MSYQKGNIPKSTFIFEHKMIKEEIETLKHIYFDNMTVFYKCLLILLFFFYYYFLR